MCMFVCVCVCACFILCASHIYYGTVRQVSKFTIANVSVLAAGLVASHGVVFLLIILLRYMKRKTSGPDLSLSLGRHDHFEIDMKAKKNQKNKCNK